MLTHQLNISSTELLTVNYYTMTDKILEDIAKANQLVTVHRLTHKEIARQAGTSRTAVSFALNLDKLCAVVDAVNFLAQQRTQEIQDIPV